MTSACTILLVDDNEELRGTLAELFAGCGFEVLEAGSAEEALSRFHEAGGDISVVVTDVLLPGADGFWLLDRIRDSGRRPAQIVISSGSDHGTLRQRLERGELAFLVKPFTLETLLSTVGAARVS
ncbi:MAG: response regulator [Thermoanaerobaculia bacterium]|nr:response regulator [Thermoanaerobaculia bacterium]